jgi:hypothetical protein
MLKDKVNPADLPRAEFEVTVTFKVKAYSVAEARQLVTHVVNRGKCMAAQKSVAQFVNFDVRTDIVPESDKFTL